MSDVKSHGTLHFMDGDVETGELASASTQDEKLGNLDHTDMMVWLEDSTHSMCFVPAAAIKKFYPD